MAVILYIKRRGSTQIKRANALEVPYATAGADPLTLAGFRGGKLRGNDITDTNTVIPETQSDDIRAINVRH